MSQPAATVMTRPAQPGISLVEILVWLAVLAFVGVFAATQFTNIMGGSRLEFAFQEIQKVKAAAENYRMTPAQGGLYTNLSVTRLAARGYNVEPFNTGTNENVYGLNVTLAAANSNTDATLTYQTPAAEDCNQLIDRFTNTTGVKGLPSCTTGTLTLSLE